MRNTLRIRRAEHGENGVSQHAVAQAIGIHRDRLHRIERGYAEPSEEEREKLAAFFGVKVSVLFPGTARRKVTKPSGATA